MRNADHKLPCRLSYQPLGVTPKISIVTTACDAHSRGRPRWPVSRSLHSFRSAAPDTRRDGLVHRRSVPAPVAVGGNDHSSVPPAAPSTGTDRFFTSLGVTGAESSAWGNWRRALRLDYMARSRSTRPERSGRLIPAILGPGDSDDNGRSSPPALRRAFADWRDDDRDDEWSNPVEVSIAFGQDMHRGEVIFAEQIGQPAETPTQNHNVGGGEGKREFLRWRVLVFAGIRIRFQRVVNQLAGVKTVATFLVEVELDAGAVLAGGCVAVVFREGH